jgi:hypothetical protein
MKLKYASDRLSPLSRAAGGAEGRRCAESGDDIADVQSNIATAGINVFILPQLYPKLRHYPTPQASGKATFSAHFRRVPRNSNLFGPLLPLTQASLFAILERRSARMLLRET